ncbi:MAG: alpha/beta fold hydrolase [Thermomicrobiales bacterium]
MALNAEDLISVPGILSRRVRLGTGAIAHYLTAGDIGPPVILLHGGTVGSSGMAGWRFMLPALAEAGFRVYAPDRPGYGFADSRPEHRSKSWLDQVKFVDMFADALGIDKFHISGNSMGSQTAIYYMCSHPDRILSSALIATSGIAGFAGVPAEEQFQKQVEPRPPFNGTAASMFALLSPIVWRQEGLTEDVLEMRTRSANLQKEARILTSTPSNVGSGTVSDPNLEQWHDVGKRFPQFNFPIIYLHGIEDSFAAVENAYLAEERLPNVQFFYPSPCGHQGQTDQPEMFNAVFSEFYRDGKVSWKTAEWVGVSRRRPINPAYVEEPAGGFPKD